MADVWFEKMSLWPYKTNQFLKALSNVYIWNNKIYFEKVCAFLLPLRKRSGVGGGEAVASIAPHSSIVATPLK